MNVYYSFDEVPYNPNSILTVGTYDGVHLGHQSILKRLIELSNMHKLRPVLLTFHPHPRTVLSKDKSDIKLLTSIDERIRLFETFGIENVLIILFNFEFSRTTPEEFVLDYLFSKVGMKKILIGYDHMFGKNREGDSSLLSRLGSKHNFEVDTIDAFTSQDIAISSTKIRKAIESGDLDSASSMLGYNYFIEGKVVFGEKRGRMIGYPTANIESPDPHKLLPMNGVYLVTSEIYGTRYYGMANLGVRPTFEEQAKTRLEVHFFDFSKEIYDIDLNVEFLDRLRSEVKFKSVDALIKQLSVDKEISLKMIKNFYK